MNNQKQVTLTNPPLWFKTIIILSFLGILGLLFFSILMPPRSYFGLAYGLVVSMFISTLSLLAPFVIALSLFPKKSFALITYWLFYKFRWLLFFFSLYGFTEYVLRLPVFYFVYLQPYLNIQVIFSIRGLLPLIFFSILIWSIAVAKPIQNPFTTSQQEKLLAIKRNLSDKVRAIDERWTSIMAANLPTFVVLIAIYGILGAKLSNYLPISWNDATGYWLWVRQFSHYGFNSGYNYANELMPIATFNRFGEGSPIFVYLYGAIGLVLGWQPHLPILINFVLITVPIYAFSRTFQLDTSQNTILALVLLISWPILLFLPTTSHETINQAIAIGMAGIFLSLQAKTKISAGQKIIFVTFLFFASLVRLSWVILFFPLLFFYFSGNLFRRTLLSGITGGGLSIAVLLITSYLVPPVNNSIFSTLNGPSPLVFSAVWEHFLTEFRDLVSPGHLTPGLATVFLAVVLLGYSISDISRKIHQKHPLESLISSQAFFDFYNMITLLATGMTLYLADGFYRVFFPHLMVSFFMQIAQKNYRFVKVMVIFSLIFAPVIVNYEHDIDSTKINYTHQMAEVSASKQALENLVAFDETAPNPWCNTILIPLKFYDGRLTALDPGIGISYILFHPLKTMPIQSNYLLLDQDDYNELQEKYNLRAVQLASLPIGNLYRNLDSDCKQ